MAPWKLKPYILSDKLCEFSSLIFLTFPYDAGSYFRGGNYSFNIEFLRFAEISVKFRKSDFNVISFAISIIDS